MKQIFGALLVILAVHSASADATWTGFKKFSDPAVPANIREASKSVFRIYFPTGPFQIVDMTDFSNMDKIVREFTGKDWEMVQLGYCRVQEISKCPVSSIDHLGGGSAFVIRDAKTLATNLHNIQPWISAVGANNGWTHENLKAKLSQIVVPIALTDQNGQMVFRPSDALSTGEAYRLKIVNEDMRLFSPTVNPRMMIFAMSDYVELEFKNAFQVSVLPLAAQMESEIYFTVGFPGPTTLFAELGAGDGDGLNQMVTTGVLTSLEYSKNPMTAVAQGNYFTRITAPSYVGNSGGPILNANAEVVGILNAGDLAHQVDGKPAYYTEFINILKSDDLQKFWKSDQH